MSLVHLRAFHTVAREGSFTAASRALYVSQPTISAHVAALERSHGVRLFERAHRRAIPTPVGRSLLDITRRLFAAEDEAWALLSGARKLEHGSLVVGADGAPFVMPALAAFRTRYPGIDLSLAMGNAREGLAQLKSYKTDIAILAEVPDHDDLYCQPYWVSPLMVWVDREHRWSSRDTIGLDELSRVTLILREVGSATRNIIESLLDRDDVKPASVLEVQGREAVREAVAAGLGVGIVTRAELGQDRRLVGLQISDSDASLTEHIVCLDRSKHLPVVRAFIQVAQEIVA